MIRNPGPLAQSSRTRDNPITHKRPATDTSTHSVHSGTDADIDDIEPMLVARPRRKRRRLAVRHPILTEGVLDMTLRDLRHWRKRNSDVREVLMQFLEERNEMESILLRVLGL